MAVVMAFGMMIAQGQGQGQGIGMQQSIFMKRMIIMDHSKRNSTDPRLNWVG